jgi:hypothetical protein
MASKHHTIMTFAEIVRACQLARILAAKYPLFLGCEIEYNGKPLTLTKLKQIIKSDIDLRTIRKADDQ